MVSDRQLKHWYDRYNSKWFNNELPTEIVIHWEPSPAADAVTCPVFQSNHSHFIVKLDPAIKGIKAYWKQVLLHEMCHIKLWPKHPRSMHGKLFQEEMKRLANANAFKTLW